MKKLIYFIKAKTIPGGWIMSIAFIFFTWCFVATGICANNEDLYSCLEYGICAIISCIGFFSFLIFYFIMKFLRRMRMEKIVIDITTKNISEKLERIEQIYVGYKKDNSGN